MNRLLSRLNPAQLRVLTWVGEGCPVGVMDGHTHKTTALALQNRRLVAVSRKGGVWRAVITDAGRQYLENGTYAGVEGGRGPQVGSRMPRLLADARPEPAGQARKKAQGPLGPKPPSPTEQLISTLVANAGRLVIDPSDHAKYRGYVAAAKRFGKVPLGKRLVMEWDGRVGEYVVVLEDEPGWLRALLDPIPVPTTLRRIHPAVEYLRTNRMGTIERRFRPRALRLLQAMAAEAERRGYGVEPLRLLPNQLYRVPEGREHLRITLPGHSSTIEVRQVVQRVRHEPTQEELARAERDDWYLITRFDVTPSERLSLWLTGGREHRRSKWADSGSGPLEEFLPQILQEIELRAVAVERDRLAAAAAAEQRRLRWEAAMEDARRAYAEAYRAKVLVRQVEDWMLTRQLRGYLDAMDEVIAGIGGEQAVASAREWQDWAEQWMKSADPLAGSLAMPVVPEPRADDLKPHLNGWSPFSPG